MQPSGMAGFYYGSEYLDILHDFWRFCEQRGPAPPGQDSRDRFLLIETWIQQLGQEGRHLQPVHLEVARLSPERLLDIFKSFKHTEEFIKELKSELPDEPGIAELYRELELIGLDWLHEKCDFFPPLANAITPREISDFVVRVASLFAPKTVLDPACGCGTLLHAVRESLHPESIIGLSGNPRLTRLARMLLGDQAVTLLDSSTDMSIDTGRFDLIVADPPQARWRLAMHGEFPSLKRYPHWKAVHSLVVWASEHLTAQGAALIFVDSSFFWDQRAEVIHRHIAANGCCIRAAFHVPRDSWWKKKPLRESYLLLLQPGEQNNEIFVAQFSQNLEHQSQVVNNLKHYRSTEDPTLGRICLFANFRSFNRLVSTNHLKRLARLKGYSPVSARDIFLPPFARWGVNDVLYEWLGDYPEYSGEETLTLCFFHAKKASFSLDWEEWEEWDSDIWTFSLNANRVTPQFLVWWFNDTLLGKETLRAARRCDTVSEWIDPKELLEYATLYLPTLEQQRLILKVKKDIKQAYGELAQLETSLTDANISQIESIALEVESISSSDVDLELKWFDSLPFPLASILWRHRAAGQDYILKYKILLSFFEATAEFLALLHLSAFSRDRMLWSLNGSALQKKFSDKKVPLTRGHFGDWRAVVEHFAPVIRKNLKDNTWKERLQQLYCVNESFLTVLCNSKLLTILQEANRIRNDEDGHTGAMSRERAQVINDDLESLIYELRTVFGQRWANYDLIQARGGRLKDGIFRSTGRMLRGTRAPFVEEELDTNELLEEDQLYLYDAITRNALPLLPLIRVTLSSAQPADTCYFYSRIKGGNGARFLSYHNEKEPQHIEEKSNIPQILEKLFPSVS